MRKRLNIPAKQRRIVEVTLTTYFIVICIVGIGSYWTRDGYVLLGLNMSAVAASLGSLFTGLNALIAGGASGRAMMNATKAAKYLSFLTLAAAVSFFAVAFSTTGY